MRLLVQSLVHSLMLPTRSTTPLSNWQNFGRSVSEPFGGCSKTNRGFSAGGVPSVDSREDTRRCAFPRQSCCGCIAGYALRAEIPRIEFAKLRFTFAEAQVD